MKLKLGWIEKNEWAVSPVIGVILLIAIVVAIAAVAFTYFGGVITVDKETPIIVFEQNDTEDTLTVLNADHFLDWDKVDAIGIASLPSGTIDAGDKITGCAGNVQLIWEPTNTILSTYTFI
jgi:FlaG/FlaF family flagellin (archaellin)